MCCLDRAHIIGRLISDDEDEIKITSVQDACSLEITHVTDVEVVEKEEEEKKEGEKREDDDDIEVSFVE